MARSRWAASSSADQVYDALMAGPANVIELFHGYTYSAHPLACAAALADARRLSRLDLFARAPAACAALGGLRRIAQDAPHVIDIRNIGLLAPIDLKPRDGAPGATRQRNAPAAASTKAS